MGGGSYGGSGIGMGGGGYGASGGGQTVAGGSSGGGSRSGGGGGRGGHSSFVPAKVFLGGCGSDLTNEGLAAYCGQWGEVADCHVMTGKGYAFVTFREVPSAQAFLEHREHFIDGRKVDVKAAIPKDQGGSKLTKKMFVGGTGEISDEEFRAYFAQFGNIVDCVVLRKHDGGSRGFGFVTYDDEITVEKCLVMPHILNGKTVETKRAVGKEQGGGGGGSGGGGMGMGRSGGGSMMGGGDRSGKQPDWVCAECANSNFGWRQFCNRCKVPRPGGALSGSMGMGGGMGGGMGAMGGGMGGGMGAGAMGGMPGMMGMGGGMGSAGMGGMGMGGYGMGGMNPMMGGMMGPGGMGMGAAGDMMGGATGMGMGSAGMGMGMGGMEGMGGGGYGRMNGARGGGGGQQQRFRPY